MSVNLGALIILLLAGWKAIDLFWLALEFDWKNFFQETFK